jgi:hypothetical protein
VASLSAIARPMPRAAPVTNTDRWGRSSSTGIRHDLLNIRYSDERHALE